MKRLADGIGSWFNPDDDRTIVTVSTDTHLFHVPLPRGAEKQWSDAEMLDYTYRYLNAGCGAGYRHQRRYLTQTY